MTVHTERYVLASQRALAAAANDAARYAGKQERGGILLGTRRGTHLHILEATLPQRWDRGSMFAFRRSARGHQEVAIKRWKSSGQTIDWLGEWHSHPESIPSPSGIDLHSWTSIVAARKTPMVFLIIGYHDLWLGIVEPNARSPTVYREAERTTEGIAFARQM